MGYIIQRIMISIIVPVYNVELYLEQCLDSLLAQTYQDIEIICVNDGATDRSAEILDDYARRDNRIKVVTQQNQGLSPARNRGMEEVQGEWVMFLDSDDWLAHETCELALQSALEHQADVVFWPYIREYENGKQSPRYMMEQDFLFEGENLRLLHRRLFGPVDKELHDPSLLHSWGTAWGKLYALDVIKNTKFVDTKIISSTEDGMYNVEVFNQVKKAFYINKLMTHYRKRGMAVRKRNASLTTGYSKTLNEGWVKLYELMGEVIEKNNLGPEFYTALNNRIALDLIGKGLNECRSPRNRKGKIAMLKQIIDEKQYRTAIKDLPIKYFPLHWKLFFWAARERKAEIIYFLLRIINKGL